MRCLKATLVAQTSSNARRPKGEEFGLAKFRITMTLAERVLIVHPIKKGQSRRDCPLFIGCLTMTYSHMGRPHTTIGAERFHF